MVLLFSNFLLSQNKNVVSSEVSITTAKLLGKSSKIIDLIQLDVTSKEKKASMRLKKKAPENFIGRRGHSQVKLPELERSGPDPIRQSKFSEQAHRAQEPKVNIFGLGTGSPLDPTGDIGRDYYVQAVNITEVGVYSKEGVLLNQFAMNTLWSEFNTASAGDPIVLYDEIEGRWIITEFADPANLLIAISDSEDPLGTYTAYSFTTLNFPDYPKFGIWPNALVVTTNEQGAGQLTTYFIDRVALMNGEDNVTMQRINVTGNNNTEAGFYVATPIDWNGSQMPMDEKPIVLALDDSSWGTSTEDLVNMFHYDIDWKVANNTVVSKTSIPLSPFDAFPCADTEAYLFSCIPQLNGEGIDGVPEVIMNIPNYRRFNGHESIVFNFITDATDGNNISGIRWVELRSTNGNDWSLYQEGTFALDDNLHRFMGSIAMDERGNIALAYNVSSENDYIGIRYTGRLAGDAIGEMTFEEYILATGENTIFSGGRFGDYADMKLDAEDGRTFWYTTEYAAQGSTKSRIVAFELTQDSIDLSVSKIINPSTSSSLTNAEQVSIELTNSGFASISGFETGFYLDGELIESITLPNTLQAEEKFVYTFNSTVDLSDLKVYEIKAYVLATDDLNTNNDCLSKVVTGIRAIDAGIEVEEIPLSCGDVVNIPIQITNFGEASITMLEIEATVNGANGGSYFYNGSIDYDEMVTFEINLSGLIIGSNLVELEIISLNGNADTFANNNFVSETIEKFDTQGEIKLTINFDNFPTETSWDLVEQGTDMIISEGGPYGDNELSYEEILCLDPSKCYSFTIFDSYADGICCDFGDGNYTLSSNQGIIIQGDGIFSNSQTTDFCPVDKVLVNLDAGIEFGNIPVLCQENLSIPIVITNYGTDNLTKIEFGLIINGGPVQSITWNGNLVFNNSEEFLLAAEGFQTGSNQLEVEIISANSMVENQIDNNSLQTILDFIDNPSSLLLEINFDDYPNETSWSLVSSTSGEVYFSDGPYNTDIVQFIKSFCLDPDECYIFTIYDSLGDGICCDYGEGNYTLLANNKEIIYFGDGKFGDEESIEFCGDFTPTKTTVQKIKNQAKIQINPNPNNGDFIIDVINSNFTESQIDVEIYSIDGSFIQHRKIGKFDDSYQGQISLVAWPDGVYILKCKSQGMSLETKVVKQ